MSIATDKPEGQVLVLATNLVKPSRRLPQARQNAGHDRALMLELQQRDR